MSRHNGIATSDVSRAGILRAGVVGIGAFGRHHANKYAAADGVELVGVADPGIEARRRAMAQLGVPTMADWRDLLGKVDIVSICSPAVTHAEIVRAFLNAGADVLVEKPIATDLDEADDLIALAEKMGRVLTVGHQERFVFAQTGLLDYAEVPLSIECWREGPWTGRGTDVSVVLDLMIHDLDLVHRLIPGDFSAVHAAGSTVRSRYSDDVSAMLSFANGSVAKLQASRVAGERSRGMRAIYADGMVEFDFIARTVKNTTPRPLRPLELDDPLGASVTAFITAARAGAHSLVLPEEARAALCSAVAIDEAVAPAAFRAPRDVAVHA